MKAVKGYAYKAFLEGGWKFHDSAIFVYRKTTKKEQWMIPVLITPITPAKKGNKHAKK